MASSTNSALLFGAVAGATVLWQALRKRSDLAKANDCGDDASTTVATATATATATAVKELAVTETANEMTLDVDVVGPRGVVGLFRQTDAQIFTGWHGYAGLSDTSILGSVEAAVEAAAATLQHSKGVIVLSGCGTSGRMAFWVAKAFNKVLQTLCLPPRFRYLMSGGDTALLLSDELPEDDPLLGVKDLKQVIVEHGAERVMLVGITCGISAPYVLGQVDFTSKQPGYTTCLMGFNPARLARNAVIEGWEPHTCREIALALEARRGPNHILLNPVIGPEPVTGSTRMKGGSATKIMLELVFARAFRQVFGAQAPVYPLDKLDGGGSGAQSAAAATTATAATADFTSDHPGYWQSTSILHAYEATMRRTYAHADAIGKLAEAAGASLRAGRHLYYIGGERGGLLGLVDASEMPDTYGSSFDEVRGFTATGWPAVGNHVGDLHDRGEFFRIGLADYESDILPGLRAGDCVIAVVVTGDDSPLLQRLCEASAAKGATLGLLHVGLDKANAAAHTESELCASGATHTSSGVSSLESVAAAVAHLALPFADLMPGMPAYAEIATKWALNAISTSAQIQKGAVYHNRMINVGVLNNKLFFRALDMICRFSGARRELARACLLQSIHGVDEVTPEIEGYTITHHIEVATPKSHVVPIAMLLATGRFTRQSAAKALAAEPVLRNIVKQLQTAAA